MRWCAWCVALRPAPMKSAGIRRRAMWTSPASPMCRGSSTSPVPVSAISDGPTPTRPRSSTPACRAPRQSPWPWWRSTHNRPCWCAVRPSATTAIPVMRASRRVPPRAPASSPMSWHSGRPQPNPPSTQGSACPSPAPASSSAPRGVHGSDSCRSSNSVLAGASAPAGSIGRLSRCAMRSLP